MQRIANPSTSVRLRVAPPTASLAFSLSPTRYHLMTDPLLHPDLTHWIAGTVKDSTPIQEFWLQRPGALTAGLRTLGTVRLRVSREYSATLPQDEALFLQAPIGSPIWVREIVMDIRQTDSVVARSITPLTASETVWRNMRSLQTRPLADMLYHDADISRSGFYTAQLQPSQPLYQAVTTALPQFLHQDCSLLARCSVFWRQQQPLLVEECFLPDFWTLLAHNKH